MIKNFYFVLFLPIILVGSDRLAKPQLDKSPASTKSEKKFCELEFATKDMQVTGMRAISTTTPVTIISFTHVPGSPVQSFILNPPPSGLWFLQVQVTGPVQSVYSMIDPYSCYYYSYTGTGSNWYNLIDYSTTLDCNEHKLYINDSSFCP